jgi:transcriptional regulator with XRE-family HTH domain
MEKTVAIFRAGVNGKREIARSRFFASASILAGMLSEDEKLRQRVRTLMGTEDLTAFAKRAGVAESTLRSWLKDPEASARIVTLTKVAESNGLQLWELFPEAPKITPQAAEWLKLYESLTEKQRRSLRDLVDSMKAAD